jgi:hypothetical protein
MWQTAAWHAGFLKTVVRVTQGVTVQLLLQHTPGGLPAPPEVAASESVTIATT